MHFLAVPRGVAGVDREDYALHSASIWSTFFYINIDG